MSHTATSLSSWAKAIKATLDQRDLDSDLLFEQAGLDLAILKDPNGRYLLEGTTRLWQLAVAATGDQSLGLSVGRNVNQTTFHALGYSLLASPTLKETFERLVRYFRIVTDAGELEFCRDKDNFKFVLNPLDGPIQPAIESLDALMSVVIRLCRLLSANRFQATRVTFRRASPDDTRIFEKVFQAPLEFSATETAIYMKAEVINEPLENGNPDLARHNDEILARYLRDFDKQNIANRVHGNLIKQLPQGEPSQEKTAEAMHMSLRNLQRKLSAEGTSYKEILNKTRHDLALSYMQDARYSISEITYLLGFSDTSSFNRAFRRWTEQSPTDYRNSRYASEYKSV
ncbi:MAG: AraC family transcriptional regulator [Oceanococcus sp.]